MRLPIIFWTVALALSACSREAEEEIIILRCSGEQNASGPFQTGVKPRVERIFRIDLDKKRFETRNRAGQFEQNGNVSNDLTVSEQEFRYLAKIRPGDQRQLADSELRVTIDRSLGNFRESQTVVTSYGLLERDDVALNRWGIPLAGEV